MKVTVCVIIKAPHHIIIAIKFSSQQVYVHGYTTRTPMALPRTCAWHCHARAHGVFTALVYFRQTCNPAPDPECKTGTLAQKQQVFGQLVLVE